MATRSDKKQSAAPAKNVLGNDPFLRGAAPTAPAPVPLAHRAPEPAPGELPAHGSSARIEPRVAQRESGSSAHLEAHLAQRQSGSSARVEARPKSRPAKVVPIPDARPKSKGTAKAGARPSTLSDRPQKASARPATKVDRPAAAKSARPKTAERPNLRPVTRPTPVVVEPEQALVKHVHVPEIDSGQPEAPSASEAPRSEPKPGALAQLTQLATRQAQSLVGTLLASPTAMQSAAAAISGATAVRALLARPEGPKTVDEFGEDPQLVARAAPTLDFLYSHYFRVTVEGAQNLPRHGPLLAIANHAGALPLDGPIVRSALERSMGGRARWLVEDAIFHAPFIGTWLNRLGAVRACPENAQRLLEGGAALAVFPEGLNALTKGFRRRYQLQRFGRGGFVKLALRTGAPIVPTAVIGAEESMPILATIPGNLLGLPVLPITPSLLPLPTKWTVVFGKPIELAQHGPDASHDLALVQRITEEVRSAIHESIEQVRARRRSIFR